jgi:hypothetical protein
MLLEQMGLGEPTRSTFVIKIPSTWQVTLWELLGQYETQNNGQYSVYWYPWLNDTNDILTLILPEVLQLRNFDPRNLNPSFVVNDCWYFAGLNVSTNQSVVGPITADPLAMPYNAVADQAWWGGSYVTGLTRDDVGGLKYLLSATNINIELLLKGVSAGAALKRNAGVWRCGVEKISFVPHPRKPTTSEFKRFHYGYTDSFYVGNNLIHHKAIRFVSRPDILFCAADNRAADGTLGFLIERTGTTNWVNNAGLNSNPSGEGPGIIQPPIKITFHKLGDAVATWKPSYAPEEYVPAMYSRAWGSFNDATNLPFAYPDFDHANRGPFVVHLRVVAANNTQIVITNQAWDLQVPFGGAASLQLSTNRLDWIELSKITNAGVAVDWVHYSKDAASESFRAVAE